MRRIEEHMANQVGAETEALVFTAAKGDSVLVHLQAVPLHARLDIFVAAG
jgi:hypothetical protein